MKTRKLTILVVVYNMVREAPNTIESMLPPYQKDVSVGDYNILVLDNGSTERLPASFLDTLPVNVRVLDVPSPDGSPGAALNWGAKQTDSPYLMVCIDGARMFSDRLVANAILVLNRFPQAFVYTIGWHLGPDVQMRSVPAGYNQKVEDELLEASDWRDKSDGLFDISVLAGSSQRGLAGPIAESNAFSLSRSLFNEIGGYDERFKIPGGSLSNLEIFERYVTRTNALNICLTREGTFHQVHGGSATSNPGKVSSFFDEYKRIFGRPYAQPAYESYFYGLPRGSTIRKLVPDDIK